MTQSDQDRIRLAEAMGWTEIKLVDCGGEPFYSGLSPRSKGGFWYSAAVRIPDPFTDANDDYAVLEWMRERYGAGHLREAYQALEKFTDAWAYKIGLNARAALWLLDRSPTEAEE